MVNVDIFSDGRMTWNLGIKTDPKCDAVFVGKNNEYVNYGQTGYALWNNKWELEFFPDGSEESNQCYIVDKNEVWFTDREINHDY